MGKDLTNVSDQDLLKELLRRRGGANAWSCCNKERPAINCQNEAHLEWAFTNPPAELDYGPSWR